MSYDRDDTRVELPDEVFLDAPEPGIEAGAAALLVAFADDELMAGQRKSEWLGLTPFLEEDLAFASIAQDELGHARGLYALVYPDLGDHGRDARMMRRPAAQFRSSWLDELSAYPWERALIRHLFHDLAEQVRWHNLTESSLDGLAGLAVKALAEEAYHVRHATDLVVRLAHGGPDSQQRLQSQLDDLWELGLAQFEAPDGEAQALSDGVAQRPMAELAGDWRASLAEVCHEAGLVLPDRPAGEMTGARDGARHADFGTAQQQMCEVFAVDPSASW